jgi:hypothetical protein
MGGSGVPRIAEAVHAPRDTAFSSPAVTLKFELAHAIKTSTVQLRDLDVISFITPADDVDEAGNFSLAVEAKEFDCDGPLPI